MPEPEPDPGAVVIKVGGAGLCHPDLMVVHDIEPGMLPYELPFTRWSPARVPVWRSPAPGYGTRTTRPKALPVST